MKICQYGFVARKQRFFVIIDLFLPKNSLPILNQMPAFVLPFSVQSAIIKFRALCCAE